MTAKRPPQHLSAESRLLWTKLNAEWDFDLSQLVILKTALEAYDRLQAARRAIERHGVTTSKGPSGLLRANPAVAIEEHARAGFLQAWRMLNLGIEPPGGIGRPPGT